MYIFMRAIAVEPGTGKYWKDVDISGVPTNTLLIKYAQVYAVLTNTAVGDEMTLDLASISAELAVNTTTFSDYLKGIGNKALPTVFGTPTIIRNQIVYSDAFEADFHVDTIDPAVGEGIDVPDEERNDLVVRPADEGDRIDYDYLTLRKRVLANVNGFYHRTSANSKGMYVIDGNITRRLSKQNHLGLVSFATIGDLSIHEIKPEMLTFVKDDTTELVEQVMVKLPDGERNDLTPLLILGGYMLPIDQDSLIMASPYMLTLKTFKYPFLDRYFESHKVIDMSAFDVEHAFENETWVVEKELRSESFLKGYFTMSQSFIVMVPTERLHFERSYPETQTVPHTYLTYEKPKWPLVTNAGKHEVYWSLHDAGQWLLRCPNTYDHHRTFHTTAKADRHAVDAGAWMGHAGHYGDAYFLKIFTEDVKIGAV